TQDSSIYWKRGRVELRAAGFDPDRAAQTSAVVTIASAYTNAHRCNNRVRAITDLLVDILAERGGQGLIVGAPAVSDALTQGTPDRVAFGEWAGKGNNITILDYAEALAANESGRLSGEELLEVERNVMPGSGTCGAMFTANTMSTIAESIGMMLPRGASHPADYNAGSDIHADVRAQARASVDALYRLMEAGI